jgi:hypothetical protein
LVGLQQPPRLGKGLSSRKFKLRLLLQAPDNRRDIRRRYSKV